MQIAAIIVTVIALYAGFYSLCRVASDAEAKADRYRRRMSQARSTVPEIWRMSATVRLRELEVVRGR